MVKKRKRPVYIVVKPTGVIVDGEEAEILIDVTQTKVAAETSQNKNPGSVIKKAILKDCC
jgi:hypothetical protein